MEKLETEKRTRFLQAFDTGKLLSEQKVDICSSQCMLVHTNHTHTEIRR